MSNRDDSSIFDRIRDAFQPAPNDLRIEREALEAFYHATNGDGWINNTNWLSDKPLSEWHGVEVDNSGRVQHLILNMTRIGEGLGFSPGNNLSGEIPPELGNLSNLTSLCLGGNNLSGEIPPELLGNLSNLEVLDLGGNNLSGEIPPELGNLSNLEALYLQGNNLSGGIPPELGNLSNLDELELADNRLTGCVPKDLRDIEDNDLDELELPDCGDASAPLALDTPSLALAASGEDSSSDDRLSARQALTVLYRATNGDGWTNNANWLSDKPLSEWNGVMTDSDDCVTALLLPNNGLSGELPSDLTNLSGLQALYLAGNPLTGCVPQRLLAIPNNDLSTLGLPDCGAVSDRAVLEALYRATNGDDWANNANWLSDKPLSEWNGVMADSEDRVTALLLPNNGLSGELPSDLANLSSLQALYLAGNPLTGCIPQGLRDVPNNDLASLGLPDCP